MLLQLNQ